MSRTGRPRWPRVAAFAALTAVAAGSGGLYVVKAMHRLDPGPSAPLGVATTDPTTPTPTKSRSVGPPLPPQRSPVEEGAIERGRGADRVASSGVRQRLAVDGPSPGEAAPTVPPRVSAPAVSAPPAPTVLFRITALGDDHGRLGRAQLAEPDRPRSVESLRCERLHFAAGQGVCLTADRRMLVRYGATLFDAEFRPRHQLTLSGVPSRVRVAPDGRHAAITVFVSGHSYAASNFSTRTSIIDLQTGQYLVDDMEAFTVSRDGERVQAIDFNFWGVTFARESHRFYATLATGGQTHLVEGDLGRREVRVVRGGIECPALSPDNTRVAFKKRTGGLLSAVTWRLSVLDLASGREWDLAETRNVDDQVEWLDNRHVLYGLPVAASGTAVTDVWSVPADGSGAPQLLLAGAASPVVVRGVATVSNSDRAATVSTR